MHEISSIIGFELTKELKYYIDQHLNRQRCRSHGNGIHLRCYSNSSPCCKNTSKNFKFFQVETIDSTWGCGDPDSSMNETHYVKDDIALCQPCYLKYLREFRSAINKAVKLAVKKP